MMSIGEYFFAILLLVLSCVSIIAKIWHSTQVIWIKAIGSLICVVFFGSAAIVAFVVKAEKPWTNIAVAWDQYITPLKPPTLALGFLSAPSVTPHVSSEQDATPSRDKAKPAPAQVSLIFKDSPLLTGERKRFISDTIEGFRTYLVGLGFNPPKDVPPIGIMPGNAGGSALVLGGNERRDRLYSSINLPQSGIDDPMIIVNLYAGFAFSQMMDEFNKSKPGHAFRSNMAMIFSKYFTWSYSGSTWKSVRSDSWESALWEIRNTCGRDFTDRSLFYMFTLIDDFSADQKFVRDEKSNYTISKEELNEYFLRGLTAGEQVVDNNLRNLTISMQILKRHGLIK